MVSASGLLAEVRSVLLKIETLPAKTQEPEVRPSAQQLAELEALVPKICEAAQAFQAALSVQALVWTREVRERCDAKMVKARAAIQDLKRDVVKWPTVKRNLVVISQGPPQPSAVDTDGIKERKAKRAKVCLALREAGHAVVLAWAVSFPPPAHGKRCRRPSSKSLSNGWQQRKSTYFHPKLERPYVLLQGKSPFAGSRNTGSWSSVG